MARLTLDHVTKSFTDFDAVKDVSIDVADGEFLAVLGPSGCGKTTLLRLVAGFEKVTSGEIRIGGEVVSGKGGSVAPEKRRVGIVFQNYALWPHMSVAENVGYSLKVARLDKAVARQKVEDALALVNLQGLGERWPANLSGGQRQRVALARCLVAAPSLVLFDEPLANLDVHLRASMEDEFAAFHKRTGTTIVYITHDQAEAMALADRIAVMDHGRLAQLATPRELYHEPANEMVASFISQGILLPADVMTSEDGGRCKVRVLGTELVVRCRPGERPRAGARICCRSADIELSADASGFDGLVKRAIYQGGTARVEFTPAAGPDLTLRFEQPDPVVLENGAQVRLRIRSGWLIPAPGAAA
ncbi:MULTISPECIES: ABC transporter ATP-binding protein [unclassified Mesorhizobium]|uniref:ABC transporter ATP-binding protein n=1 Tax=unclassified Mesorhizobium TaxID=325217 RepID=UPI001093A2E6|nr:MULTISPECIES: ABC transporter ATP-binding protein [unclassified Mesorhizobium]TGT45748.1 ABC transporter ATP-binding protein [Mesorhizobium sp. M8A.F.Ca.ET.165.01.1.1]TGT88527.1 ABC transporter ATP-binding protein [Mesorhizobium sp. M8A.F.Ca.ET.161.01.1.1]TGV41825.1 ABC transporter ATP-binding protein [Mesorhizobium sp. M8A.F.Ca.ET.142.01.1.1]